MARKRKGNPVHGWVVLDKPLGMSSAQAVAAVRRLFNAQKAGHGGTLDPLATGVLPIALGEATKTVSYVMAGTKLYGFTLRWGEARDTDDGAGAVTATSTVRPGAADIAAALPAFTGTILQAPPAYSAIKLDGERSYDLARQGAAPTPAARPVRIDRLHLVQCLDAEHASFEAEVGKGTYIRALGRDLAQALGTVAHVTALRRLRVGRFHAENAISLDNLALSAHSGATSEHLLPVETALDDIPALALTAAEAAFLRHGRPVLSASDRMRERGLPEGATVCATAGGRVVALARIEGGGLRPIRVMSFD